MKNHFLLAFLLLALVVHANGETFEFDFQMGESGVITCGLIDKTDEESAQSGDALNDFTDMFNDDIRKKNVKIPVTEILNNGEKIEKKLSLEEFPRGYHHITVDMSKSPDGKWTYRCDQMMTIKKMAKVVDFENFR